VTVAKAESEQLLNAALPFAQQLLMKHCEFFPYGFAMKPSAEIISVAGYDGRERPPPRISLTFHEKDFEPMLRPAP